MIQYMRRPSSDKVALLVIVIAYVVLGIAYGTLTPPWQVPDEPAHFNYIRYIADEKRLPVLEVGDYDQVYLEEIKARRFPPEMSIDGIRYESHQPPLYYLIASAWYLPLRRLPLAQQVVGLRLLSLLIGAGVLPMAYLSVLELFPGSRRLALGATAFIAFLPMHITFTAGINNDPLAELILSAVLWQLLRLLDRDLSSRSKLMLGATVGLALLTKSTGYIAVPLTVVAVFLRTLEGQACGDRAAWKSAATDIALILGPALLIALPWLIRNALIYGPTDLLGLGRHDQVVLGQLTTSQHLGQVGFLSYVGSFAATTFRSFWAQFGWMGILVDQRIYVVLAVGCLYVTLGVVLFALNARNGTGRLTPTQRRGLSLLTISALLTTASYLWYNTKFVQFQGRYLFPALIPISLAFSLGVRELLRERWTRLLVRVSGAATMVAGLLYLANPGVGRFPVLLAAGVLTFYLIGARLPYWLRRTAAPLLYAGLYALAIICLWGFIVPYFT